VLWYLVEAHSCRSQPHTRICAEMRWNLLSYKGRSAKKNWTACVRGRVLITSLLRLLSWFFAKGKNALKS
jgi:hypothetical protein